MAVAKAVEVVLRQRDVELSGICPLVDRAWADEVVPAALEFCGSAETAVVTVPLYPVELC